LTARILVVDDIPANVKLLEARLMAEYFQVLAASSGAQAIQICERGQCDLVLLDVMMPEIDGFETCRRLKANPNTHHLPVVLVTALDQPHDRVRGLEAGADDFLTKPINDLALVTRVKSLVRLKMLTDELRLRADAGQEFAIARMLADPRKIDSNQSRILVVDDRRSSGERIAGILATEHAVTVERDPQNALFIAAEQEFDSVLVSLSMAGIDPLRLCSHLRSLERTRSLPIVVVAESDQESGVIRALELGVNDYIRRPVEQNELLARMRTQIRRKRYNDHLRNSVQSTIELAFIDPLTNLRNRRYFDTCFANLFEKAVEKRRPLAAIMCDIDNFKRVNDRYGHDIGDSVICEFAARIRSAVRNSDLVCRFGGEEFTIALPDTGLTLARAIGERIRGEIARHPFVVESADVTLDLTVSVGVAAIGRADDSPEKLLKRADVALYDAKRGGRNRVITDAA
jgi:two-component system, cell cycle response regulator